MSTFPEFDEIGWAQPSTIQHQFKTLISSFNDQGKEKRRRKWLFPKRFVTVQYQNVTKDESRILWQFFLDRSGSYQPFSYYNKEIDEYTKEYVGTGDGGTSVFSLPSKEATNYDFYFNNTLLIETTDYEFFSSLGPSGGTDGSDRVVFVSTPEESERITYSFNGKLRIVCRFREDNINFQTFHKQLTGVGIELQGLLIDEVES